MSTIKNDHQTKILTLSKEARILEAKLNKLEKDKQAITEKYQIFQKKITPLEIEVEDLITQLRAQENTNQELTTKLDALMEKFTISETEYIELREKSEAEYQRLQQTYKESLEEDRALKIILDTRDHLKTLTKEKNENTVRKNEDNLVNKNDSNLVKDTDNNLVKKIDENLAKTKSKLFPKSSNKAKYIHQSFDTKVKTFEKTFNQKSKPVITNQTELSKNNILILESGSENIPIKRKQANQRSDNLGLPLFKKPSSPLNSSQNCFNFKNDPAISLMFKPKKSTSDNFFAQIHSSFSKVGLKGQYSKLSSGDIKKYSRMNPESVTS